MINWTQILSFSETPSCYNNVLCCEFLTRGCDHEVLSEFSYLCVVSKVSSLFNCELLEILYPFFSHHDTSIITPQSTVVSRDFHLGKSFSKFCVRELVSLWIVAV